MELKDVSKNIHNISKATSKLKSQSEEILSIITTLKKCRYYDNTIFVCGNGGSASTASHLVCDLFKFSELKAVCLCDTTPLVSALTNDIGWDHVYDYQLKRLAKKDDVLIVISVHGGQGIDEAGIQSGNLVNAIDYANSNGIVTIGLTGGDGGYFENCKLNVIVPSNSTPIIESVHSSLAHLIAFLTKEDKL